MFCDASFGDGGGKQCIPSTDVMDPEEMLLVKIFRSDRIDS